MNNEVLIVGANGFLGANISYFFAKQGVKVTALCRRLPQEESWSKNVSETICGDVTDIAVWESLSARNFKYVIYLVSLDYRDSEGDLEFVNSVNILPLWRACKLFEGRTEKFIYLSTQKVYGAITSEYVNEETPCRPGDIYGLTHFECENILEFYNRKSTTEYISVRLSNSYGMPAIENRGCWSVIVNDLCRSAVENGVIALQSDGSPMRDFIYMSDVVGAIYGLCVRETKHNIYNLSSGVSYSIAEIARRVQENYKILSGREIEITTPENKLNTQTRVLKIDNARIKSVGVEVVVDINDGVKCLLEALIKMKNN